MNALAVTLSHTAPLVHFPVMVNLVEAVSYTLL